MPNFENFLYQLTTNTSTKTLYLNDGFCFFLPRFNSFILHDQFKKIYHPDFIITDNALESYNWQNKLSNSSISDVKILETGTPLDTVFNPKLNLNNDKKVSLQLHFSPLGLSVCMILMKLFMTK